VGRREFQYVLGKARASRAACIPNLVKLAFTPVWEACLAVPVAPSSTVATLVIPIENLALQDLEARKPASAVWNGWSGRGVIAGGPSPSPL
jgi:hypothetical protein